MKTIPLTKGLFALVDDDDYKWLSAYKWQAYNGKMGNHYAVRSVRKLGKVKGFRMHRMITNAPRGMEVDHKNGNGLDNRKQNLRVCTVAQNHANRRVDACKTAASKYKGVFFRKNRAHCPSPWKAVIKSNNKIFQLGHFQTEIQAAIAYNKAALEIHGEFARLNPIPFTYE